MGLTDPCCPCPCHLTANLCVKQSAYLIHIWLGNGLPPQWIYYIGCDGLDPCQEC